MAESYISELKKARRLTDEVVTCVTTCIRVYSKYGKFGRKTILNTLVHVYTLARDIDRYIEIAERAAKSKIDCAQIILRVDRRLWTLSWNVTRWRLALLDLNLANISPLCGPKDVSVMIVERCALAEWLNQNGPKLHALDEKIKPIAPLT